MPKRVASGGTHLLGLPPEQHSYEETSQPWRANGDTVSDLSGPRIKLQTFRTDISNNRTKRLVECRTEIKE